MRLRVYLRRIGKGPTSLLLLYGLGMLRRLYHGFGLNRVLPRDYPLVAAARDAAIASEIRQAMAQPETT
jgi:hypothetical protein